MDSSQSKECGERIDKLERLDLQDLLTMVEIMSNITFFGGLKKANCRFAEDGQCSMFHLQSEAKDKIPVATECRITNCCLTNNHYHLETSNVTCTFCPQYSNNQSISKPSKKNSLRRKSK